MKFNEKLIQLRKQKGYSQEVLADKLNVSRQAISRWENGETTPEMPILVKLCEVYEISADYLIKDDLDKEEDIPIVRQKIDEIVKVKRSNNNLMLFSAFAFVFVAFCAFISLVTAQNDTQIIVDAIWLVLSIFVACLRFALYVKNKK